MLYATTRNKDIRVSPLYPLTQERAEDGGLYIPADMRPYTPEEISSFALKNPNQAMAEILNKLFDCSLTRWDIDFAVGRNPVRLSNINRRVTVAESWHNRHWEFSGLVQGIVGRILELRDPPYYFGGWPEVAVRIGVLFGVFGELMREGFVSLSDPVDLAVNVQNFSTVMSAWYAREWGLPIGTIIICCNENNHIWDFINHGELRTGISCRTTNTPACDYAVPPYAEMLVASCGGDGEVKNLLKCQEEGRTYFPGENTFQKLRRRMYVSVSSQNRLASTILTAYHSGGYVFGPYSALTYGGLNDHRSQAGESGHALILSERGALCDDRFVANSLGISVSKLQKILD